MDGFNESSSQNTSAADQGVSVSWDFIDATLVSFGVLGVIGNMMVFVVFLGVRQLRKVITNYFIVSLALADLIASLCLVSQRALLKFPVPSGVAGLLFCKFIYSEVFFWISVGASTLNLLGVTCERYLAIVHPLRYNSFFSHERALYAVLLSWIVAVVVEIFAFIIYGYDGTYCVVYFPTTAAAIANGMIYFLTTYLIPLVVMTICYLRIVQNLNKGFSDLVASRHADKERALDLLKARRRVVKMLCIVVITFFVCWTPSQIIFLASFGFGVAIHQEDAIFKAFTLLAFSNSCINPIIYAFRSRQFREGVSTVFCRRGTKITPTYGMESSNNTP